MSYPPLSATSRWRTAVLTACIGISCALTTGCSANYSGERLFWKAEQLDAPILKDVRNATPEQYAKAIQAFQLIVQKTPGTIWAPRAHLAIGSLYAVRKQYAKAREAYGLVVQNYNQQRDLSLKARLAIAKTYELEENWADAIKIYGDITDFYTWSVPGIEAPLYVARLHDQHQEPEAATAAYEHAAKLYNKLLLNAPTPALALQVKGYLVMADQRLGRWDEAAKTLEEMLEASAGGGTNRPIALITLGALYEKKLNNPKKARATYATFITEFPDHQLAKSVKAELERMGVPSEPTGAGSAAAEASSLDVQHLPSHATPPAAATP